ncbi:MAG: FAD-dependent monooxygenase [Ghiorsea sp.]
MHQQPNHHFNGKSYDVVIVGAGAVGSALALHLSQLHYRIAIIDCQPPSYVSTNPERVIALSEGSARYMQKLGVWQDMIADGSGDIRFIHAFETGNTGHVDMSHQEIAAQALGYVLEIRQVVQPLHHAIAQSEDIDFICPAQCVSIEKSASSLQLNLQTEQGTQAIHTSLLIGADGTNSHIRNLAGITTAGWDHNRVGVVASIACQHGHGNMAYECFKHDGPLALLPLADGRFSLVWSVQPQHAVSLMHLNDQDFLTALQQAAGKQVTTKTGDFTSLGKRACFPLELRIAQSFGKSYPNSGNIALVGNAAHTIHPIAGQGMNLGLRDVAVLADVLQQDWAKKALTSPMLVQTYAERRRLDTLAVAGFTETTLTTFAQKYAPMPWLRGQSLNLTQRSPSLKQILLQQAAGLGQLKGIGL